MKNAYQYITPLIIGIFVIGIVWFVTDLESQVYFWKITKSAMLARLYALGVIIVMCYIYYIIANKSIIYFMGRVKNDKPKITLIEYGLALAIAIMALNSASLLVTYFINKEEFTWTLAIRNNALVVPILFIYYVSIRNSKVAQEYRRQALQLEKIKVDQLETELKFLKAQYHPHFLFNALNSIYFQVDEKNREAKQSIEQLSGLLRYQLYGIEQQVTMEQEINYLRSYIAFQQLRMTERLVLDVYFDPELKEQKIHPLLFQPLIENAFKYVRGEYRIKLEMKSDGNQIRFEIKNSTARPQNTGDNKEKGIGIGNLRRRLDLLYPGKYNLEMEETERMYIVELNIRTD